MKWLGALFGQPRLPASRLEAIFALATASVTLEATFELRSTGSAGLVFRPVDSQYFDAAANELEQMLRLATRETGTEATRQRDALGFEWIVLRDEHFEDLIAAAHTIGHTLADHGFGDRLLAAMFGFQSSDEGRVYWVYSYKRGSYYPFVPRGEGRERDNALELRLAAVMRQELPVEAASDRWYPLWGAPV